jgi:release factor glutamine methyltransferase
MNEFELILTDILNCSRADLYLNSPSIVFGEKELRTVDRMLKHRGQLRPIQHILGYAEFMGLRFKVNKDVLIPRPETELLVEAVIEEAEELSVHGGRLKTKNLHILDIGTGSGCIAIALAKLLKNADIVAIDISRDALKLAKENAKFHKADNIKFLQADISHIPNMGNMGFLRTNSKFDIIVANPPYIQTQEIGILDATINNEPKIALDGGIDGLDFYRSIESNCRKFLKRNSLLILELGDNQVNKIREIFSENYLIKKFKKDYQDIERMCIIRMV